EWMGRPTSMRVRAGDDDGFASRFARPARTPRRGAKSGSDSSIEAGPPRRRAPHESAGPEHALKQGGSTMANLQRAPTRSVRDQVSPAEWQKRVDLAACYRLIDLYGMSEMSANHVTTRVPGEDDTFLINPHGMLYEEMNASCFIKMKLDGTVV